MVTRCPLEVKMKKSRTKDFWHGKITYGKQEKEIKAPADVEKMIRDAQNDITGSSMGISDKLISLEVTSANIPDLTLIDLPGITRVALNGQPENIGEQIKKLIRKFIAKKETINLVVVPCNVDIATTEALKMAQEVDPHGKRTLGILTKPDLVDKGTEKAVVSIINNEIFYLSKGYMIVRCRGQKDIEEQISLQDAMENETEFFENHPQFRTLYDNGKATIPNLAEKLTLELVCHIEHCMPLLEEEILKKLAETQAELDLFGLGPSKDPDQRLYLLTEKITTFTRNAINLTAGEEVKGIPHINIFSALRKQFTMWKNDIFIVGEGFDKKIETDLQDYEVKYRGRELPGFLSYRSFEDIVKEQIKQLEEPALRTLKEISDLIKTEFIKLAEFSFLTFPNLLKIAKTKIEDIKKEKESEADLMLRTQFKMERLIFTQDKMYMDSLNELKKKEEEAERQMYGVACPSSQCLYDHSDLESCLLELRRHLKSYYRIATMRLADQVPLVIRYMVLQESAVQLQIEMIKLIQDRDNTEELLAEENDITNKRENLKSRYKRLAEARNKLASKAKV